MTDVKPTCRVLVLEDDADYQSLIDHYLANQPESYEVVSSATLADAIGKLKEAAFDAILSDLSLPDANGLESLSQLSAYSGEIPIIALTSLEDEALEARAIAAGGQDYLIKGEVTGREIGRAIQHAIRRQQSQNEIQSLVKKLSESHEQLREQAVKLKRKNRYLKRLHKLAHEFVDNVSHDFRTPLTVIKDYVSLIREGIVGEVNDEQKRMLDKVGVRADDLNHMVDDLLDVSKLDSGMLCCWRRIAPAAEILQRVQSMVSQRAELKEIQLAVRYPADLPLVYCDTEKADRVLTNLAVNAIKFSESGSSIRLWAEADPAKKQVVIGVTDNGPGISKEAVKKIFERFAQVDSEMQPTSKGVGLGLSIAQRLTRLNLGELDVKSEPGVGSTFTFTLPYAEPVEVFLRWSQLHSGRPSPTQLIEVFLPQASDDGVADEFDRFISGMLRRDDLLLQNGRHRWLLVLHAERSDLADWKLRLKQEHSQANRNRPGRPLPNYLTMLVQAWTTHDSVAVRQRGFEAACTAPNPMEPQGETHETATTCLSC